jgi:microcompartment protein CcmK/EutM
VQLAQVIGTVVATVKDGGLEGRKLLLIQPIAPSGEPRGELVLALDAAGVGLGERVFYVRGREAAFAFLPAHVPADATIVGKVDSLHVLSGSTGKTR